MNDDRLLFALKRLGHEELSAAADRKIKARLETAWTARARALSMPAGLRIRRFAPALAALVLIAGFGGTALSASADSPLWDTRVALESAGAFMRLSNDERVAYLVDLVQSRTEEAARQQAAGHPVAAAKARAAASAALVELHGNVPQIDTAVPLPTPPPASPSPSPVPTSTPSASPSASHSPSGAPAVQPPASTPPPTTRTVAPTATPVRTETPTAARTATPTPSSASTKQSVTITGTVHDASGANVTNACISTSPTPPTSTSACTITTTNGSYSFTVSMTTGTSYTITLYAYFTDSATGALSSGSATTAATAPTTVMPTITLTARR